MGDYGFGLNTNDRALSPVDLNQLTNNQSLFSPEPLPTNTINMQDETLAEKSAVKQQQLSSPNPDHGTDTALDDSLARKVNAEQQNGRMSEDKGKPNMNESVNSVITSLNQLGLSEPSTAVNNLTNTPSFWSTAATDDAFISEFQGMNGTVAFQNFPPATNALFNTSLTAPPQLGLGMPPRQQQPPPQQQRRAITGHHHNFQQRQHHSNIFLNNTKAYPTWSSAPHQQSWAQQNQAGLNPWGNMQQQNRRSVPNLNPIGAPGKKPFGPRPSVNSAMLVPQHSKYRRSSSYPGHMQQQQPVIGTKMPLDFATFEDQRDNSCMLGLHQVRYLLSCIIICYVDDIIYLFRMAQLNTVHIKIYTRFLFSEVLIHTIVQSCNIRKYKIK